MMIHRRNSYAPRGKRRPGRREAQNRGSGQQSKNPPSIIDVKKLKKEIT
jgi:hypothetical protein